MRSSYNRRPEGYTAGTHADVVRLLDWVQDDRREISLEKLIVEVVSTGSRGYPLNEPESGLT